MITKNMDMALVEIEDIVLDHRHYPRAVGRDMKAGGEIHVDLSFGVGGTITIPEVGEQWVASRITGQQWVLLAKVDRTLARAGGSTSKILTADQVGVGVTPTHILHVLASAPGGWGNTVRVEKASGSTAPPGVVAVAGAGLEVGTRRYVFSWSETGTAGTPGIVNTQSMVSPHVEVTTDVSNARVQVTLPTSGIPTNIGFINIYRTKAGQTSPWWQVAVVAVGTATYTDLTADSALAPNTYPLTINQQNLLRFSIEHNTTEPIDINFGNASVRFGRTSDITKVGTTWDSPAGSVYSPIVVNQPGTSNTALAINQAGRITSYASGQTNSYLLYAVGDTQPRFVIRGHGLQNKIEWGPGGSTLPDTAAGRLAANVFGVQPDDTIRTGVGATGSRPSASAAGAGSQWYDTTLSKPIWSDGTVWRDAVGTAV